MIYNQDEEENFLTDNKIEERIPQQTEVKRRGGAYVETKEIDNTERKVKKVQNNVEESSELFSTVILVIAIIIVAISIFIMVKIFTSSSQENNDVANNNNTVNTTTNNSNSTSESTNNSSKNNNTTANGNSNSSNNSSNTTNNTNNTNNNSGLTISSTTENYDAYPVKIESVVYKKGGYFYNNNDKIKGDKVYVEYKQISGIKDTQKQKKINEMLKNFSVELYDKNYLSDKNTLFVDIYTKLSVNFNTLSYVVYRTGQDIEGIPFGETIKTLNIRLDTLEEIDFEDLFVDNANIKNIYKDYVKGKVDTFYFDPKTIYVYDSDLEETKIDMSKNYSNIAIYKRYSLATSLFTSSSTSKKVFTILDSTVSEETTDRAFEKND